MSQNNVTSSLVAYSEYRFLPKFNAKIVSRRFFPVFPVSLIVVFTGEVCVDVFVVYHPPPQPPPPDPCEIVYMKLCVVEFPSLSQART